MSERKALDEQYEALEASQKRVLDHYILRGKKTKWLNAWVQKLGKEIDEMANEDIDELMKEALEWVLIDFEDYGHVRKDVKCECGKSLRYRYTIQHMTTGKIYKLGAIHLEEHTGIAPETVKRVLKEMKKIDLEKDEILTRVKEGWKLPLEIPQGFEVPQDMILQLKVGLPLLERQEKRLADLIQRYNQDAEKTRVMRMLETFDIKAVLKRFKRQPDTVNLDEIKCLNMYLEENKGGLEKLGVTGDEFKTMVYKAEAQTNNKPRRKCLVALEYLDL